MQDLVEALAKLSEVDGRTRTIDAKLAELPMLIEKNERAVGQLRSLLEMERQQLAQTAKLRDAQVAEIEARNEALSLARGKSAKAQNTKEAKAAELELQTAREILQEREKERDRLNQAIADVESKITQHENDLAALVESMRAEEEDVRTRVESLRAERDRLRAEREPYLGKLPSDMLRRYEALREQKGTAVAELRSGACTGCHRRISPQQALLVSQGKAVIQCPSCQRFLYALPAPRTEQPTAS